MLIVGNMKIWHEEYIMDKILAYYTSLDYNAYGMSGDAGLRDRRIDQVSILPMMNWFSSSIL